jgi:hypothetical protein
VQQKHVTLKTRKSQLKTAVLSFGTVRSKWEWDQNQYLLTDLTKKEQRYYCIFTQFGLINQCIPVFKPTQGQWWPANSAVEITIMC